MILLKLTKFQINLIKLSNRVKSKLLNNNVDKRYYIDIVVAFNKQQLKYYIVSKVVKNASNLLSTTLDQLNVIFKIITNNNLILLKDIVEFEVNINKESIKSSLKKNIKLYCCCDIVLVILNRVSRKIDIKTKINCLNILICLIKSSILILKRKQKKQLDLQYICYIYLKDLASYFEIQVKSFKIDNLHAILVNCYIYCSALNIYKTINLI